MNPFEALDALFSEIARLREAYALLEEVWGDVGPYKNDPISRETHMKLCRFFKFDDSE